MRHQLVGADLSARLMVHLNGNAQIVQPAAPDILKESQRMKGQPMAVVPSECKVALLAGGTSGERDISINSGKGSMGALQEAGFDVTWIDPANKEDLKRLVD